ncbi:septation protein SpoVG family protein [Candidatus Endomicrobiellum agilis]|uniref:septation protein SpoVG family protein n=1 Tax=Candidatus Endomicrobiellum agilis TaxID=3238957 RepID=UPI0035796411|nr:SpoVG family protein [Endomicrobium sp.]
MTLTKISLLVLIVSLILCSSLSLYAALKVTEISQDNKSFNIVLNDDIKVSNILLKNNDIELPIYKGKNKVYKQFGILKREFRQYLVNALSQNKTSSKSENTVFKANKLSILKKHPKIKAFASVVFSDDIEIECRIMQSKRGLWIAWPSNKRSGIWVKDFEFINKDLRETVEKKLLNDYISKSDKAESK